MWIQELDLGTPEMPGLFYLSTGPGNVLFGCFGHSVIASLYDPSMDMKYTWIL